MKRELGWDGVHWHPRIQLEKTAVFQIVLNHNIRDRIKDKLDVAGVGGARKVRVNLFLVATLV